MSTDPGAIAIVTLTEGSLRELAETLPEQCRLPGRAAVLVLAGGDTLAGSEAQAADRVGQALRRAGLPAVISVQGPVRAAGLAAMLHFDVAVCHPDASLSAGDAAAALACGLAWPLRQLLGPVRARALLMAGHTLTAAEARQWGLIAEVDPDCAARARAIAASWAAAPAAALLRRAVDAAGRLPAAESRRYDADLLPLTR